MEESKEYIKIIDGFSTSKLLKIAVYSMLLSFFYNLPVLTYSVKGDNEFRLYDIVGVVMFYFYIENYQNVTKVITSDKATLHLYRFIQWCTFMWFFTLIFSIGLGKIMWALQSFLYLFHLWSFYLGSVFLKIIIHDKKELSRIVYYCLFFALITFLIVILQNFNIIPFLWNDEYLKAYNFLSGTLGPNKIVLGMTCFFILALCLALLNEKRVKINRVLLISVTSISLLTLVISGSRTTYIALAIFFTFFIIRRTKNALISFSVFLLIGLLVSSINNEIFVKANKIFENRVENKIKNPNSIEKGNVDDLYEDLGSGRKGLSLMYIEYLSENPIYIPFGIGFNNRLLVGSSAHNMYLSLINEVGLVGLFLYFRWLIYYLFIKIEHFPYFQTCLFGFTLAMIITLMFGEHLYIYRPLFGLFGLFLFIINILLSPIDVLMYEKEKSKLKTF